MNGMTNAKRMTATPSTRFRLPAEWEPQEAVMLAWPRNSRTWPGRLEEAQRAHIDIIREIAECQDLWLIVQNGTEEIAVQRRLILYGANLPRITFFHHLTNDAWIRDYGPITLVGGGQNRLITDWLFNGWGGKYDDTEDYRADDRVPEFIAGKMGIACNAVPLILEGGSIDVNGCGTLLTSRSCLLNPNRNPELTRARIETTLENNLGVKKIIWVGEGIVGDDTDGHIDDTARFVNASTVVCAYEENTADANHAPLKSVYESLRRAVDQDGRPLHVVKLPMPEPVHYKGERLPASYANFLITNEKVLVPVFGGSRDRIALGIVREFFRHRAVIGINARDLVIGFGSIHCLSRDIPAP